MDYILVNGELYHHGIKGQKWGVRRWQNEDGTFNEAGKRRYFNSEGSAKGNAHRALAKIYDINEKYYSKRNSRFGQQMASMNRAAKEEQLNKAEAADKVKGNKPVKEKITKADKIDSKIENAKNARQMESAMKQKAKEDIRSSQGKVSRFMHDISGYNNELAKRVVKDVATNMQLKDIDKARSKMSEGEKFADVVLGGSARNAASAYRSKGYKDLNSEYEKYKANGGIRTSKRNYEMDKSAERMKRTEQMYKNKQKQREENRRYENEKRKREEAQNQAIRNLNYQAQSYQNAMDWARKNKNNWY